MLKTAAALATLLMTLAGLAAAQTQTYSFNPGVTCVASWNGRSGYQIISCSPSTSVPNADGTTATFQIVQASSWQPGTVAVTVTDSSGNVVFYSGPETVTVSSGLNPTISSTSASGAFAFRVSYCWGGGRSSPSHCQLVSIGSPSGTLAVTQ